jgi:hypothetical protein
MPDVIGPVNPNIQAVVFEDGGKAQRKSASMLR